MANWDSFWKDRPEPINGQDCFFSEETFRKIMGPEPSLEQKLQSLIARLKESKPIKSYNLDLKANNPVNSALESGLSDAEGEEDSKGNLSGKGEKTELCLSSEVSTSSSATCKQEEDTDKSILGIKDKQRNDGKDVENSLDLPHTDIQNLVSAHNELANPENCSEKGTADCSRAEISKNIKEPEIDDQTFGANFSSSTQPSNNNSESVVTNVMPKQSPEKDEELCLIMPSVSDEDDEDEDENIKSNLHDNNSGSLNKIEPSQVNNSESSQMTVNDSTVVNSTTPIEGDTSLLCHPLPYNIPDWDNVSFQGNAHSFASQNTPMETVNEKEWSPDDVPIFSVKDKDSKSSVESSKVSSQRQSKAHEKQPKSNNIWSAIATGGTTGTNKKAGNTKPVQEDQASLTAQQLTSNSSQISQKQRRSNLTRAQHKEYMLLFNKFVRPTMLGGKPPVLSQADLAKLSVFEVLHQQVSREQEEYQLYLQQSAVANPQAYSFISKKAKMYSLARAQCHRTDHSVTSPYMEKVPDAEIPLTARSNDGSMKDLVFSKTLLEVGIPPRVTLPELQVGQKQVVIPKNKPQLETWFPTNMEQTEGCINHQPVRCDPNARSLATQHSASIVMSSSVLKCLLDNHAPTFDHAWNIVVTVMEREQGGAKEDKVIYLDKPSFQGDLITRDYNNLFHKYAFRTFVSHPRNPASHTPKGTRRAAANMKRKFVPPEEKAIDDPFDMFSDVADSLETFGGGSKKAFQPTEKVAQSKCQSAQQEMADIEDSTNVTRNEKRKEEALSDVDTSGIQLKRPQTELKESGHPECPVKKPKIPEAKTSHPSGSNSDVSSTVSQVASPVQRLTRRKASLVTPKPPNSETTDTVGEEEVVTVRTTKQAVNVETEGSKPTSEVPNKNLESSPVLRSRGRSQRGESLPSKVVGAECITAPVAGSLSSVSGSREVSVSSAMASKGNETPPVMKKRGRPRKNVQSIPQPQHDSMQNSSLSQSSTESFTQPGDSSEKLMNEASEGKRKRGRPRKNKIEPTEDSQTQQSNKEITCEQKEKVTLSGDTESPGSPLALQIPLENSSCPASPVEASSPPPSNLGVMIAKEIPLSPVKVSPKETKDIVAPKKYLDQAWKGVVGCDEKVFNPLDSILGPAGPSETSVPNTSCWRDKESMSVLPPYEPCVSLMYNLWDLGSLRLLIRCNGHGILMDSRDSKKPQPVYISPKLEYQPTHGFEQVTLSEVTRAWTSCYIRPHTNLLRARINAFTSEILMFEVLEPAQILQASLPFNPRNAFTVLNDILHHLTSLDCGKYLLSHTSGKETCKLHKLTVPEDQSFSFSVPSWSMDAKSVFLHPLQATWKNGKLPWIPIDPSIPTANHVQYSRVPGTFYPKDHTMKDKNPPEKHRGKKGKNRNKQGKKR